MTKNFKELLTRAEAAELLGVKPSTLAVWACYDTQPDLPYTKIGRCVRYPLAGVESFIQSNMQGGGAVYE